MNHKDSELQEYVKKTMINIQFCYTSGTCLIKSINCRLKGNLSALIEVRWFRLCTPALETLTLEEEQLSLLLQSRAASPSANISLAFW